MEINHVSTFRHRSSQSSDRFLGLFKTTSSGTDSVFSGDELHESEVFFTSTDSSDLTRRSASPLSRRNLGFRKSGILAALSDDGRGGVVLPSTTLFRAIPKPPPVQNQRVAGELTQSAPINVPPAMMRSRRSDRNDGLLNGDENEEEAEMLPPHEIVAMKVKTASSVLEGAGRTLKGRDLRQVSVNGNQVEFVRSEILLSRKRKCFVVVGMRVCILIYVVFGILGCDGLVGRDGGP